jgi:hypothetical protein
MNALAGLATSSWAYPALESAHIAGIGLLLGSLVVFELRAWGLGAALPAQALARLALPVAVAGFTLCLLTGTLMFASQADEFLVNPAFGIKLALLTAAGCNAVLFHSRGGLDKLDRTARWQSALSLGLWIAVIIAGRWIAYV